MKAKTNLTKESRMAWSFYIQALKSAVLSVFILIGILAPLKAQEVQYTRPTWWFGAAAGANFNFYRGSTQNLNADLTVPVAFHNGYGAGLYVAPLVEVHRPSSVLGAILQIGYDNRKGSFNQVITPCNCPADLSANLSYITVEPSLRLAPFKSDFYLFGGPRVAFNIEKAFTYQLGPNRSIPTQVADPEVKGDFSKVNNTLVSMQIGAGYDFQLSSQSHHTQYVLSPFVSFQPYYGQSPRSVETWNITTLRVGAALKFGRGRKIIVPVTAALPVVVTVVDPEVQFTVNAPKNIPVERRVREIFPLRNYIFFNLESTEIPDRYVLLKNDQVKDFREDQLESFKPINLSGRS